MIRILFFIFLAFNSVFACSMCSGVSAYAHTTTDVLVADSKLVKIGVSWTFDETSSRAILASYDKNGDKKFDANEIKEMFDALSKLQNPKFMTSLAIDSKQIALNIQNFKAFLKDKSVVMTFDIVINYALAPKNLVELYFVDSYGTLLFLQPPETAKLDNLSSYKIKKTNNFKVLRESMTVANVLTLEITK